MQPSKLRIQRLRRGWPAAYVAFQLGVTDQCIYDWETGRRGIPDKRLAALQDLFGQRVTRPARKRAGKPSSRQ